MKPRRYISPLRYPGGKARLSTYLADMFVHQVGLMDVEVWVEPFAGGLGAGLALLEQHVVEELWFAEANPAIAAFWRAIIADTDAVADTIRALHPTLTLYRQALQVVESAYDGAQLDDHTLGIAAFIVNRCSRSGIVAPRSGPIGGNHQRGRWTIADRFDPAIMADRIRALQPLADRLRFLGPDGIGYIAQLDGQVGIEDELVLFVDPPYLRQGNRLYANGMTRHDHHCLARALHSTPARWLLTYDNDPTVHESLYPHERIAEFTTTSTANDRRDNTEYVVFSDNLAIHPEKGILPRTTLTLIRGDHEPERYDTVVQRELPGGLILDRC